MTAGAMRRPIAISDTVTGGFPIRASSAATNSPTFRPRADRSGFANQAELIIAPPDHAPHPGHFLSKGLFPICGGQSLFCKVLAASWDGGAASGFNTVLKHPRGKRHVSRANDAMRAGGDPRDRRDRLL
jgi:hypothetical protein